MVAGLAVAVTGADASQINLGSQAGSNAAVNNFLNHPDATKLRELTTACNSGATSCTPQQREQLADLLTKDNATNAALEACAGVSTAYCNGVRADYAAAAASFLPTDDDIWTWARTQSENSNGKYTAAQIYDAYRTNFIAGAVPNVTVDDLTEVAEWMRGRIVGDGTAANPGEGPLSVIAMGWAVGNNASAQGALSAGILALGATVRVATLGLAANTGNSASSAVMAEQQRIRLEEMARQFSDRSIATSDMTLKLGGRTLTADPATSRGAPVFVGATDAEVAGYFRQLAGVDTMPNPSPGALAQGKTIYSVKITEGQYAGATITLRDFSTSTTSTGAKWTIDIKGNPANMPGNPAEIKFK
jgi:filamentous hemagglutinin